MPASFVGKLAVNGSNLAGLSIDFSNLTDAGGNPARIVAGDVAFVTVSADRGTDGSGIGLPEFDRLGQATDANPISAFLVKELTGLETSLSFTDPNGSEKAAVAVAVYRGIQKPTSAIRTSGSGRGDPGNIEVGKDRVVIASTCIDDIVVPDLGAPSPMTLAVASTYDGGGNASATTGIAHDFAPGIGFFNPGEFTGSGSDSDDAYICTAKIINSVNLVGPYDGPTSEWSYGGIAGATDVALSNGFGGMGFTTPNAAFKGIYNATGTAWIINASVTPYETALSATPAREELFFTTPAGCTEIRIYPARASGSDYVFVLVTVEPETDYVASFWHELVGGQHRVGRVTLYEVVPEYIPPWNSGDGTDTLNAGIDLSAFYVDLPVDDEGDWAYGADAAQVTDVAGYEQEPWFDITADGTLGLAVPVDGERTSSGTSYARSELREAGEWTIATGGVLNVTMTVHELAQKDGGGDGDLVIAQVKAHDGEMMRLYIRNGVLRVGDEYAEDGLGGYEDVSYDLTDSGGSTTAIAVPETIAITMTVTPTTQTVEAVIDGTTYSHSKAISSYWSGVDLYFKCGAYSLVAPVGSGANTEGTGHAAVEITALAAPNHDPATGGTVKVWNGTAFVDAPVKYFDGSAFVEKPLKRFDGSAWS